MSWKQWILFGAIVLPFFMVVTYQSGSSASDVDVVRYAREQAQQADRMFKANPPNDGATMSARAYAREKAIVYEYVIAFRNDMSEREISAWRVAVRGEIVPPACRVLRADPYFKHGVHFVYRYLDRAGKVMDEFPVNQPACAAL